MEYRLRMLGKCEYVFDDYACRSSSDISDSVQTLTCISYVDLED